MWKLTNWMLGHYQKGDSVYGKGLTHEQWCQHEIARINSNPKRRATLKQEGNKIAIYVNVTPYMRTIMNL